MKHPSKLLTIFLLGLFTGAGTLVFAATAWQDTTPIQAGQIIEAGTIKENFDYLFERSWDVVGDVFTTSNKVALNASSTSADLTLDVEGKVGAREYCDEEGENCVDLGESTSTEPTGSFWDQELPASHVCQYFDQIEIATSDWWLSNYWWAWLRTNRDQAYVDTVPTNLTIANFSGSSVPAVIYQGYHILLDDHGPNLEGPARDRVMCQTEYNPAQGWSDCDCRFVPAPPSSGGGEGGRGPDGY